MQKRLQQLTTVRNNLKKVQDSFEYTEAFDIEEINVFVEIHNLLRGIRQRHNDCKENIQMLLLANQ